MNAASSGMRRMRPVLGTFVEVGLFHSRPGAAEAIAAAFDDLASIERLMSFQDPGSELSRLNAARGHWTTLSRHTLRVLRLARGMTEASGGAFNCTVGGALIACGRLPDHGNEASLLAGIANDIELKAGRARLRRPVHITLDGIAKGYAVDSALAVLRQHGHPDAWINAGGDLAVRGHHAIPVRLRGSDLVVEVRNSALATSVSGPEFDASLPGSIVDARAASTVSGAWSVLAHRAWRADALTKVAALARAEDRPATLARLGGRQLDHASRGPARRAA